jgi:hypothetical protein
VTTRRSTSANGSGRDGALDPLERLGRLSWRRPRRALRNGGIVGGALAGILVGLGVTVALVSGIAAGISTLSKSSPPASPAVHGQVTEVMKIVSGTLAGAGDAPMFTNPSWTVRANERVTVKIISYDDGTAPLMGSQMMYASVLGTTDGTESVAGQAVTKVPDTDVAHTFTVVGLGFNMPIPAAPTGKSVTVEATFIATKTGSFTWQCYAPCGTGVNGMGGAMSTMRWMEGTIKVTA